MSERNPHYCGLDPYDPDYRPPEDCPGCDRDRYVDAVEDIHERYQDELRNFPWHGGDR